MSGMSRWGWPALLALAACAESSPTPEPVAEGIFAPLGAVMPRATAAQKAAFERGKEVAERRFTPEEGLGPLFNVVSCAACHEKPVTGGAAGHYRDFLLVRQVLPDGSFVGLGTNGVQDQFAVGPEQRVPSSQDETLSATRNPIPFFGVGLLAEIPDAEILARADPDDADGDGISGRPNYDRGFVGRFGVKAQTVSIEGFIRGPLMNHVGLTSEPLSDAMKAQLPVPSSAPEEEDAGIASDGADTEAARTASPHGLLRKQVAAPDEPNFDDDDVPDPEFSEQDLFDLVSFAMLLAAPQPDPPTDQTRRGRAHFEDAQCTACHVPALRGPKGLVPAYTDLLLHDMGEALADGIVMAEAKGREFRTAPLWGVSAIGPYLHDGRADTLDEAIRAHGGEADASRKAYEALDAEGREDLGAFLLSLGGRAQVSQGLLAPDDAVPTAGEFGCAVDGLNASERTQFERGRAAFDRDMGLSIGMGPRFNGDACRACHFLPTIGGAGPGDVDVTRQAIAGDDDTLREPSMGTMAHRHQTDGVRPPIDADANVFERRQTPALFGLGLIEQIDADAILAQQDPEDADGDGVRGRARVLDGGRVGRFGWKAMTASVRDFVRDAFANEMGITIPDESGSSFGASVDDDALDDPEAPLSLVDDVAFFTAALAAPPRAPYDDEARGRALFERSGCDRCHTPELPTAEGSPVALFSDLLLHDVGGESYVGIPDGPVTGRELRTPPLWGLRETAPYMHDGSASTIEQAIALHESEGETARAAFEALTAAERAELLAFLASL